MTEIEIIIAVFRRAKRIIEKGGDPEPCRLGAFCLGCCIGRAKGDVDKRRGAEPDVTLGMVFEAMRYGFIPEPGEEWLVLAKEIMAKHDNGKTILSRAESITKINKMIADAESMRVGAT